MKYGCLINGPYRYYLSRTWRTEEQLFDDKSELGAVLWIMLNPSTADGMKDDPTMRRVIAFSKKFGFAECLVANLFSVISSDPRALIDHPDPVGPESEMRLEFAVKAADRIICAWGVPPGRIAGLARLRVERVLEIIGEREKFCLGITKDGWPRHPLFLPSDAELEEFKWNE